MLTATRVAMNREYGFFVVSRSTGHACLSLDYVIGIVAFWSQSIEKERKTHTHTHTDRQKALSLSISVPAECTHGFCVCFVYFDWRMKRQRRIRRRSFQLVELFIQQLKQQQQQAHIQPSRQVVGWWMAISFDIISRPVSSMIRP